MENNQLNMNSISNDSLNRHQDNPVSNLVQKLHTQTSIIMTNSNGFCQH